MLANHKKPLKDVKQLPISLVDAVKDNKHVVGFIKNINVFGEVTIRFNSKMRLINPNISVSEINSTIIDAYI